MNLKKMIAAAAASAVAVSAMATSVSAIDVLEHGTSDLAFQAQTVHYNLVKEVKNCSHTVVLTASFESVILGGGDPLVFSIDNITGWDYEGFFNVDLIKRVREIRINGTYVDQTGANVGAVTPIYFTTNVGADNYNANLDKYTGRISIAQDSSGIAAAGNAVAARLTVEYSVDLNDKFSIVDPSAMDKNLIDPALLPNLTIAPKNAKVYTLHDDGLTAINQILKINVDSLPQNAKDVFTLAGERGLSIDLDMGGVPVEGTTAAIKYDKSEKTNYYPFKTGLNDSINYETPDVMDRLTENGYVNNMAVINDLIANYDEVTFKFNTAVKPVNDAGKYDDNGNKLYTSFAQHLYNLYGEEYGKDLQNTGYINYDWTGYNLFTGALIINDQYSMSLNDTSIFDYGETSLSFNWADLNNGAAYNPVVNYVQSIKLATSREWYWDSLDITGVIVETDQAATNEGTEVEEETIGEDEEAGEEEEELGEDEETEEEPAVEEEAAAPAENPATGNAPIALAVIPVALAAAAVVAKKRG